MISVAMATYNGEKFLREQLDSILNQTYKDIELIVCDDCSTDSTWSILQEYQQKDSRIRCYKNAKNLGFKKNFGKAISLCNGEFIALSDQDDIWEIWKLDFSINEIKNFSLFCTNSQLIDADGCKLSHTMKDILKISKIPPPMERENQFKILVHNNFCQGSTILARSDFLKNCIQSMYSDTLFHDYWFAIYAVFADGLLYSDSCPLLYRQHNKQITENTGRIQIITNPKENAIVSKNNVQKLNFIKGNLKVKSSEQEYIMEAINYYKSLTNKNWSTFMYFIKNYEYIILKKSFFLKLILISKKFLGLLLYKIKNKYNGII